MTFLSSNAYVGVISYPDVFPMPIRTTYPNTGTSIAFAFPQAATGESHKNWRPVNWTAGSLGTFKFYAPNAGSPWNGVTTTTMDSKILINMINDLTAENSAYIAAKATYETERIAYNTALS